METYLLRSGQASQFLKDLQAQCVPWDKQPFMPSGHIICKVEGLTFTMKLEPLSGSTVVYLYGRVESDGLVSWQISGSPALPIVYLFLNAIVWFMLIATSGGTLAGIGIAFVIGVIMSGLTLGLYLFIDKRNQRIGDALSQRVIQTAKLFAPSIASVPPQ